MGRPRDHRSNEQYYKAAKRKGYRSRSAFKLKQIISKHNLLEGVDKVIELCCCPGGWTQILREMGPHLEIVAVDIDQMNPIDRISFIQGDIRDPNVIDEIEKRIGNTVDLVISDCSPKVSGTWDLDVARQLDLARITMELGCRFLKRNGKLVAKVFQGAGFRSFLDAVRTRFKVVRLVKPDASRKSSAEIYLLAMYLKEEAIQ